MVYAALLTLILHTPFEDVLKRFTVDLPQGWEFAPLPGDVDAASFKCVRGNKMALASIRILPAPSSLDKMAEFLEKTSAQEPNYKQTLKELTFLADTKAVRRRYTASVNKTLSKTVEQRFIIIEDKAYLVHVESLNTMFKDFTEDFNHIFDTFKPAAPAPQP